MRRLAARFVVGATLAFAVFLAGCAIAPTEYRPAPPVPAAERPAHNLRVFDRAWDLVDTHFYDATFRGIDWAATGNKYRAEAEAAGDTDRLYAVMNRMLDELGDSHLTALSPRRTHELRTQHRAAVGFRMLQVDGKRVVTEVLPDSPASRAGLQRGWIATTRDGQPIDQDRTNTSRVGTPVTYGFLDASDEPRVLTMTPELLNFSRTSLSVHEGGVVCLRFDNFNRHTLRWLSDRLKEHRDAPGVIVDLRQNSGGSALSLIFALGEFFEDNVAMGTVIRRSGRERGWDSLQWFPARYTGKLAVLVDTPSASSSEIFAHVVRHYRRGVIVGRKTAGAVMAARFYSLPDGGKIEIPVENYIGLDGSRLEQTGVTPDIVVERPTLAEIRAGRDPDVEAALAAMR